METTLSNENSSFRKSKPNRLMLLSTCVNCSKKKCTFIKNLKLLITFETISLK